MMDKILLLIIAVFSLGVIASAPIYAQNNESIAVIVNQDAITQSDVLDRIRLIASSTGLPMNGETQAKLRPQIINMLVDEALKIQEAKALGIKIEAKEIDNGFASIAQQNNFTPEQFKKILQSQGVNFITLRDQIASQIAWAKIVQRKIRPRVEIMDSDIDVEIKKLQKNIGQTQYRLSEIFIPLTDPRKENAARQFTTRVVEELRKRPESFPKAAQQLSQTPQAANGGDMGFVSLDQLPKEIAKAVPTMIVNEISLPIKTLNGFHIIVVRGSRIITANDLPPREAILQRLGNEKLDRGARRYLQDMTSSAFIETRL